MSGSKDAPGDAGAQRDLLGPWPVELRVLDAALEEGLLDRSWVLDLLAESPYDAAFGAALRKVGVESDADEPATGQDELCEVLFDRDRRTKTFDLLALVRAQESAASYVLLQGDEVGDEVFVDRLVQGFLDERVSMAGALALVARWCGHDEVRRTRLMQWWFDQISEAAGPPEDADSILLDEKADGNDNGTVA